jgi:hypothetical protein
MRAKIKDYEHWVYIGIALVVVGFIVYYHSRMKKHKPLLADVALEKVVEKVHAKNEPPTPAPSTANERV